MKNLLICLLIILFFVPQVRSQEKKFKVGFTMPLTGPFAEFGVAVKNAVELAKEQEPSLMRNLALVIEDDQYSAKSALSAFKKLKDVDNVNLILVWGNEPALAVAPVAENENFPLMAFGQTPAISVGRKNVLRVLGPADEFGKPIAEYLNKKQAEAVKMILVDNTFYNLVAESIQLNLSKNSDFKILASVPASEVDFRPYLLRLKNNPKEYLGVFLSPAQLIPFFKQAKEIKIINPIFGSTAFESKAVISEARKILEGAVYAHVTVDPVWHENYLKRFGDDIQVSYAAVSYDIILAIARTVAEQSERASGHLVLRDLASLPEQKGASGRFYATSSKEHGSYINFEVALKNAVDGSVISMQDK